MVVEIRTAALQVLPLIAYVTKPQTGGLWICGNPNKVKFYCMVKFIRFRLLGPLVLIIMLLVL